MFIYMAIQAISQLFFGLLMVVGLIAMVLSFFDKSDRKPKPKYKQHYCDLGGGISTLVSVREQAESSPGLADITIASSSQRDAYWGLISFAYQKLKLTSIYKQWKYEQFDCQFGKCGICGKPMDRGHTQLDHIKARYGYGTNYSDNLVLVHPKCNEKKGSSTGTRPDWVKENPYSKEFDKKSWEILQEVRKEYPDKVPDSLINSPQSIEESEGRQRMELDQFSLIESNGLAIADELNTEGDDTTISPEQGTSEDDTSEPKTYAITSYTAREHVNPSSLFRKEPEVGMEHGTAIHSNDAVYGENDWDDIMLARHDAEMRAEYSPDVDDLEYVADQYMSYDYDDWSDKYGPEW